MKTEVLGSAAMGLGISAAALWALRHAIVQLLRDRLQRLFARDVFTATSAYALDWSRNQSHADEVTYFMKPLHRHARTGDTVMLVRYPRGQMNPPHTHPVGHGIYVLEGTLVTHRGSFGPHTYVWFPPNEPMTHGAGPDEDLVALFSTSRNFRTEYVGP